MPYSVPEPVGGGGQGNATGPDGQWEDLANNNPSSWAPGRGEEEYEDGNESNLRIDGGNVVGKSDGVGGSRSRNGDVGVVEANSDTNDGHEELADEHSQCAPDKKRSATNLLDSVERDRGGADVNEGEDEGDQEGVGDGSGRL